MAKPHVHAASSARQFGGKDADYLPIHEFMDSSKEVLADNRHRALTHNAWFIRVVLPRVFSDTITNSDGKTVSVMDIGEQHILEDFGMNFIPTAQDYLENMDYMSWMTAGKGEPPSSFRKMNEKRQATQKNFNWRQD